MDARILYLDSDDEITTAANRVREADVTRIAIVLPFGSRVATSRINFRLLSRDATLNGKRLSVVASEAATRALAASAGLPVFSTVAEYEASEEGGVDRSAAATATAAGVVAGAGPAAADGAAVPGTAGGAAAPFPAPGEPGDAGAPGDADARSTSPRGSGGRRPRGQGSTGPSELSDADDSGIAGPAVVAAGAFATGAAAGGAAPLSADATPSMAPRPGREPHAHRLPSAVP